MSAPAPGNVPAPAGLPPDAAPGPQGGETSEEARTRTRNEILDLTSKRRLAEALRLAEDTAADAGPLGLSARAIALRIQLSMHDTPPEDAVIGSVHDLMAAAESHADGDGEVGEGDLQLTVDLVQDAMLLAYHPGRRIPFASEMWAWEGAPDDEPPAPEGLLAKEQPHAEAGAGSDDGVSARTDIGCVSDPAVNRIISSPLLSPGRGRQVSDRGEGPGWAHAPARLLVASPRTPSGLLAAAVRRWEDDPLIEVRTGSSDQLPAVKMMGRVGRVLGGRIRALPLQPPAEVADDFRWADVIVTDHAGLLAAAVSLYAPTARFVVVANASDAGALAAPLTQWFNVDRLIVDDTPTRDAMIKAYPAKTLEDAVFWVVREDGPEMDEAVFSGMADWAQ